MNPVQHVRQALLARAAELGIAGASEEATIDALLDREVRPGVPTEADCRAYYDQHRDTLRPGSIAELDHILFAVTDPAPHPALREKAQAVLADLLADDRGFAQAARAYSNCPSAEVGGNLGQLTQGDVVPEFWRAIAQHAGASPMPGVLPQLVESRFGLHIVRVNRLLPGEVLPYEIARTQIEEQLAERNLRVALHEYVHGLVHPDCDDDHDHDHPHHDHAAHHAAHHDHRHPAMNDTPAPQPHADVAQSSVEDRWATAVRRHDAQEAAQRKQPAPAPRSETTGCGGGGGCACAGT